MRLDNKVAIVTGGSSGIGKETVFKFLSEGASVVAADINTETLDPVSYTHLTLPTTEYV